MIGPEFGFRNDEVHGGAMPFDAGRKGAAVGVEPFELRQQRGVNVQQTPAPARDDPGREKAHESRKAHKVDALRRQFGIERAFERFAIVAERPVIDQRGRDAQLPGMGQSRCIGLVRYDEHDFRRVVRRLGRLDQRRHVRATARDEHGDALFGHPAHRSRCP